MSASEIILAAASQVVEAMYRIWGVVPDDRRGSYVYQTDPYPITGSALLNGTAQGTIQVSQGGAFILTKHAIYASTYDFAITWVSGGSDRRWCSRTNGGHVNNLGGTGQFPYIYPQALLWPGGATITCQVESLTAASRSVYWDFSGWRAWDVEALRLARPA